MQNEQAPLDVRLIGKSDYQAVHQARPQISDSGYHDWNGAMQSEGEMQLSKKLFTGAFLLVFVAAGVVTANENPTPGSYEALLLQRLAIARSEADGRLAESAVWEHWFSESPSAEVHDWLQQGRKRRESYDYEAAEKLFNLVVETAPDYAEGYNQRAFVRFLRENYDGALADLEKTLEFKPWHFGALSGMYHVLRLQNRHSAAFDLLSQAVDIHPWIQERGALPKELWPDSFRLIHEPGQEI